MTKPKYKKKKAIAGKSLSSVSVAVLKNKLSSYLRETRKGYSVTVTEHGHPIAQLVPLATPDTTLLDIIEPTLSLTDVLESLKEELKPVKITQNKTSTDLLKEDREDRS